MPTVSVSSGAAATVTPVKPITKKKATRLLTKKLGRAPTTAERGEYIERRQRKAEKKRKRAAIGAGGDDGRPKKNPKKSGKAKSKASSSKSKAESELKAEPKPPGPQTFDTFEATPFSAVLTDQLVAAGFGRPTPIQAEGWPAAVAGDDLIAVAKTGSGKTLGFLMPIFHRLRDPAAAAAAALRADGPAAPRAVVIAPTRELATQIKSECDKFGRAIGVEALALTGGTPIARQLAALIKARPEVLPASRLSNST